MSSNTPRIPPPSRLSTRTPADGGFIEDFQGNLGPSGAHPNGQLVIRMVLVKCSFSLLVKSNVAIQMLHKTCLQGSTCSGLFDKQERQVLLVSILCNQSFKGKS